MQKDIISEKLDEVNDLLTEAVYVIRELKSDPCFVLGKKAEYLDKVAEIILLLSEIRIKGLDDMPIEIMYKLLYRDYKTSREEVNRLKKEIKNLAKSDNVSDDVAELRLMINALDTENKRLTYLSESRLHNYIVLREKYKSSKKYLKECIKQLENKEQGQLNEDSK